MPDTVNTPEYRYWLSRVALADDPQVFWIMLNPSTADDTHDDPTIRRVRGFTERLGHLYGFTVVNLYAYRATKPADLWKAKDPVGPANDAAIAKAALGAFQQGTPLIAAWGAHAKPARVAQVLAIPHVAERLYCLGVTNGGQPRHPLYLSGNAHLTLWSGRRR